MSLAKKKVCNEFSWSLRERFFAYASPTRMNSSCTPQWNFIRFHATAANTIRDTAATSSTSRGRMTGRGGVLVAAS